MVKHHDNRWQHHKAICQGSILKHCCGALTVEHQKKRIITLKHTTSMAWTFFYIQKGTMKDILLSLALHRTSKFKHNVLLQIQSLQFITEYLKSSLRIFFIFYLTQSWISHKTLETSKAQHNWQRKTVPKTQIIIKALPNPQNTQCVRDHWICIQTNTFSVPNIKDLVHLYSAFPKEDLPVLWTVLSDVVTEHFFCVKCWEDARIKVEEKNIIVKRNKGVPFVWSGWYKMLSLPADCTLPFTDEIFLIYPPFPSHHTHTSPLKQTLAKLSQASFLKLEWVMKWSIINNIFKGNSFLAECNIKGNLNIS